MDNPETEKRIERVAQSIREFKDFPKSGINFRDIFSLTKDPNMLRECNSLLVEHVRSKYSDIDAIVGLDSRGFIFGPLLAQELNVGFVPIRKAGKLPGETVKLSYDLEYGTDSLEVQKDAVLPGAKVIVIDDLLATGGTMKAAVELLAQLQANILECVVVIELSDLAGRKKIPHDVFALISINDS